MKHVANYSVLNRILPIALIAVLSASCEEDNGYYCNGNYTLAKTKMTRSLENQPTAPVKLMVGSKKRRCKNIYKCRVCFLLSSIFFLVSKSILGQVVCYALFLVDMQWIQE